MSRNAGRGRQSRWATLVAVTLLAAVTVACASVVPTTTTVPLVLAAPLAQGNGPTPTGRIVFVVGGDLWQWHDGLVRQLTTGERFEGPAWSPEGERLAVSMVGVNHSDLAILNADGALEQRLTDNRGRLRIQESDWARLPAWAPDGTRIAYTSDARSYDLALWTIGPDGRGARQVYLPPDTGGGVDRPSWSPTGNEIALATWRPGASQVEVFTPATGRSRRITEAANGAYDPAWSPAGNWIAYVVRDGAAHDVWLVRPDGSESVRLTTSGRNRMPAWSPDGAWVAFLSLNDVGFDVRAIRVVDDAHEIEPGEGRALVSARPVEGASGLTWAP